MNNIIDNNAEKVIKTESVKENKAKVKSVKNAIATKNAENFAKSEFQKSIDKLNIQQVTKNSGTNFDHNYENLKHNLKLKFVAENCTKLLILSETEIQHILKNATFGKDKISNNFGENYAIYRKLRVNYRKQRDILSNVSLKGTNDYLTAEKYVTFYKMIVVKKQA